MLTLIVCGLLALFNAALISIAFYFDRLIP